MQPTGIGTGRERGNPWPLGSEPWVCRSDAGGALGERRMSGGLNQGGWQFKQEQEPCRT